MTKDASATDRASFKWSSGQGLKPAPERLMVEAPLAIEIAYDRAGQRVCKQVAVTMRTPGEDGDLVLGFLYCEGLIDGVADLAGYEVLAETSRGEKIATWRASLMRPPAEALLRVSRGILTSAACGLCGRNTLEGLRMREPESKGSGPNPDPAGVRAAPFFIDVGLVAKLPDLLRLGQKLFSETGGCHGAGLFTAQGGSLLIREDVGRHNAVDKVVGAALKGGIRTSGLVLVLSGRAGFELVQKAAASGLSAVVAVGAPSSLAAELADGAGITLIGFAREGRFNVYAHPEKLSVHEPRPAAVFDQH